MQVQTLEDRMLAERQRLASMNGFMRMFKKRSLTRELDELAGQIESTQGQESELLAELDALQKMEPPGQQGLDVSAKRSINFMIISYAQQLFLHFVDDELASLSKEASEKSVGAINYGGKENCDFLLGRIAKRIAALDQAGDLSDVLKRRAQLIAESAAFRNDEDAVPIPATVATAFIIDAAGGVGKRDANLVGDNYWDISKVLGR